MGECDQSACTWDLPFAQRPIIVLGVGIIGCAAARQLLRQGLSVTLVAEFLPGDQDIHYASAWAGDAWHAAGGITADQRHLQAITHRVLLQMAQDPQSGVSVVDAREHLEQDPSPDSAIWGSGVVSKFRQLNRGEYPSEFTCGWAYEPLVTDPIRHMPYLKREIQKRGGCFIRRQMGSLQEVLDMFPASKVFINASGLGSRDLADVGDVRCFAERGQNVFLRTDLCHTMYFRNGCEYTYIIPRPHSGGVVLGGVKQENDVSPEVDMDIARDVIARAHRLAPEMVPAQPPKSALGHIVGIRPSRRGGFRLDTETRGPRTILSAYEFGGGGYSFSYGVAEALVRMVEKAERDNLEV
ncbi:Uncharacterized protein PECH_002785 [Penicillium ucsense]|uniref:FAD dependent oxidoreductase domain-containing protein n=1 Tax=Penicillium ucsense TaxID=2839758 RepID=A0A8J8VWE2_9EURO|nr:Uncharacterized protein PECM_002318 [Penicillium ucsense]KAF7730483.1 Uncharacterized protein PECH_002785 [Penicillium ucsense]